VTAKVVVESTLDAEAVSPPRTENVPAYVLKAAVAGIIALSTSPLTTPSGAMTGGKLRRKGVSSIVKAEKVTLSPFRNAGAAPVLVSVPEKLTVLLGCAYSRAELKVNDIVAALDGAAMATSSPRQSRPTLHFTFIVAILR